MTYRERRLAKAERLREWADKRNSRATAQLNSNPEMRHDWAFITQPGRIPARARMNAADDRAHESLAKANSMMARAEGIEHQADRSIYSDDPDAPERLREKIAELEAKRDKMKATNQAFKKGDAAFAAVLGVTVEQAAEVRARIMAPGSLSWHRKPFAPYELTNLGANIRRQKERLAQIERDGGAPWKYYHASKYPGTCIACQLPVEMGTSIVYKRDSQEVQHYACYSAPKEVARG
jgi:DNA repair exonuclease SbcCD ATPase subunit